MGSVVDEAAGRWILAAVPHSDDTIRYGNQPPGREPFLIARATSLTACVARLCMLYRRTIIKFGEASAAPQSSVIASR